MAIFCYDFDMNKFLEIGLIIIAASAVAVADVFIKKSAFVNNHFSGALRHPLMILVAALYILQVVIFAYLFTKKVELGVVGIIETALYAVMVVGSGVFFFEENISLQQGIGMALAIIGVAIINL